MKHLFPSGKSNILERQGCWERREFRGRYGQSPAMVSWICASDWKIFWWTVIGWVIFFDDSTSCCTHLINHTLASNRKCATRLPSCPLALSWRTCPLTAVRQEAKVNGMRYIDTPGLADESRRAQAADEVKRGLTKPGPHPRFWRSRQDCDFCISKGASMWPLDGILGVFFMFPIGVLLSRFA